MEFCIEIKVELVSKKIKYCDVHGNNSRLNVSQRNVQLQKTRDTTILNSSISIFIRAIPLTGEYYCLMQTGASHTIIFKIYLTNQ